LTLSIRTRLGCIFYFLRSASAAATLRKALINCQRQTGQFLLPCLISVLLMFFI